MNFGRMALGAVLLAAPLAASRAASVTGAGSSFAAPIYTKWAEQGAAATGVQLNYNAAGSGAGIKFITARTVDFGASDKPLGAADLQKAGLAQFPTVMGAVDLVVNIPGIGADQVKLTGPILAGIYLGNITKWNDPAIARINQGVTLPALDIAPIYRADGSGTTFVFTTYLSKVNAEFKSKVGASTAVQWPAGQGAKGTAGVAGAVKQQRGGLGYVESAYATLNHLTTVQLQNADGQFLRPTLAAFTAAAANANWSAARNFAVDLTNEPGAQSWPIVSATFVLLPTNPRDPARQAAVLKLFDWGFTSGDAAATALQYVVLPAEVKTQVRALWKTLGAR